MQNSMTPYQPGDNLDSTTALLIGMKQKGTLQSYVAAHRGTPEYPTLLALATSINNVSAASNAAKYQPPAQTVADQRLASLAPAQPAAPQPLPESQGIGQLPAPNLEAVGKAAGGIIAFNDGGEVPRFSGQYGSVVPRPVQRMPGDPLVAEWDRMYGSTYNPNGTYRLAPEYVRNTETKAYEKNPIRADQDMAMFDAANTAYMAERDAKLKSAPAADTKVDTALEDKTDKTEGGIDKLLDKPTQAAPKGKSYEERYADIVYKNAPNKEDFMKEAAEIDKPVLEKAQAAIDAQKGKLKSETEQNFFMSMIIGGLEAAGGDSQYALQNIAKGGSKGAAHFNEGLKDLRKAAQENTKMEIELAKYEATGKKDALKSYYDAQARRDDRYAQGMGAIFTQQMQTQGQMAVASMPGAQERLFKSLADPTSATAKGFKTYAETMGPEAKGDTAIRTAAINKWSSEPMLRQEFNNDFNSYLRMMSGQQMVSGATPSQLAALKKYGVSVP